MSGIAMGFFKNSRVLLAAARSSSSPAAATKKTPAPPRTAAKGPPRSGGITKPVPVSPALRKFLGVPEASRAEAVKKIWEHIKLNNLQNPTNKREILCDEKLKSVFEGKDKVGFLEIGKLLSHHFIKTV
ncbi:hypothetical protein AAG906_039218 [Vitis piasezkii]|uniref:Upstream activation factor subunit spp27 n=2 Tax=Vitis vinifera TaxID=29760 RepID=A5BKY5_VITVI|eukprot:XP_002270166.1 PREDICTED: upstream activation factor subunit spp27 [Vitis vinifera]